MPISPQFISMEIYINISVCPNGGARAHVTWSKNLSVSTYWKFKSEQPICADNSSIICYNPSLRVIRVAIVIHGAQQVLYLCESRDRRYHKSTVHARYTYCKPSLSDGGDRARSQGHTLGFKSHTNVSLVFKDLLLIRQTNKHTIT